MRGLTEQEIKYRNQKYNELPQLSPSGMSMVIGFDNGFIAGVESQQAEIERLRAALRTLVEWTESQGLNVKVYDSDSGDIETEWPEVVAARAALGGE